MPPRGYANLSLKRELANKLRELQARLGLSSLGDVVAYLLETHSRCTEFEQRLRAVEEKLSGLNELEATMRKLYLALTKLLEELEKR